MSDLEYAPGETSVETPLPDVLRKRSGVCQDFAHLMIACLRSRGLAARYVSGYLRTNATARRRPARVMGQRSSERAHPMPGWLSTARRSAGSSSTRRTIAAPARITSPSPGGAISAMSHRCAA